MAQVSTGLRQGEFSLLKVLSQGNFVDILTLINQGGGGGSVQSVSAPLALTNGVLSLGNFTQQDWEDSNGIVRSLVASVSGGLVWNQSQLVDLNTLGTQLGNYVQAAYLTSQLALKQGVLSAGSGISIANNVISATASGTAATQAWVTANFLSPLNPGTVGAGPGLSGTLGANSWILSVDENTDSRTKFILRDSNNVARQLQASLTGQLMWNSEALCD